MLLLPWAAGLVIFGLIIWLASRFGPLNYDEARFDIVRLAWRTLLKIPWWILHGGVDFARAQAEVGLKGFFVLNFTAKPLWMMSLIVSSFISAHWVTMALPTGLGLGFYVYFLMRQSVPWPIRCATFLCLALSPLVWLLGSAALSNFGAGLALFTAVYIARENLNAKRSIYVGILMMIALFLHYAIGPLLAVLAVYLFLRDRLWKKTDIIWYFLAVVLIFFILVEGSTLIATIVLAKAYTGSTFTPYWQELMHQFKATAEDGAKLNPFYYSIIFWKLEGALFALVTALSCLATFFYKAVRQDQTARTAAILLVVGIPSYSLLATQGLRVWAFFLPLIFWLLLSVGAVVWSGLSKYPVGRFILLLLFLTITIGQRWTYLVDLANLRQPHRLIREAIAKKENLAGVPLVVASVYHWPNQALDQHYPVQALKLGGSFSLESNQTALLEYPEFFPSLSNEFEKQCSAVGGTLSSLSWSDISQYRWTQDMGIVERNIGQKVTYCLRR